MNDLYLTLIFITCMADAMTDGFRADIYNGISNVGWHRIKWVRLYPSMIAIALQMDFWYICLSPLVAWIGWQFGLSFTPVRWKSMWIKWIVILFNKVKSWFKRAR